MNKLNLPFSIGLYGKPRMGKSYLIRYMLSLHTKGKNIYKKFNYGIVFSKTVFNKQYDFFPSKYIYPAYNEDALRNLMAVQSQIRLEHNKIPPQCVVIFDDCLDSKTFNSQLFRDLCCNYRHYSISLIVSTQYPYLIPPVLRSTFSYVVIFKQFGKRAIEAVFDSHAQIGFDKLNDFKNYMATNTGDYKFIFVDNECNYDDINEMYKIMKAPARVRKPNFSADVEIQIDQLKNDD